MLLKTILNHRYPLEVGLHSYKLGNEYGATRSWGKNPARQNFLMQQNFTQVEWRVFPVNFEIT